jgi:hypothetical protein
MKNSIITLFFFFTTFSMVAQSSITMDSRKGAWIIESGTSAAGLFAEGGSLFILNIDAGKFVSNNFALKLRLQGIFGDAEQTVLGAAAKYYLGKKFPLEVGVDFDLTNDTYSPRAGLGFVIALENNIYLEPSINVLLAEFNDEFLFNPKLTFVMLID